jgi:gliding motility-associated protein GldC
MAEAEGEREGERETATEGVRSAEVHFHVALDERHLPVEIRWSATDAPEEGERKTKSVLLSIWDSDAERALCVDLWTKDMRVDEMRVFVVQTLFTMADTLERATSERAMSDEIRGLANRFADELTGSEG